MALLLGEIMTVDIIFKIAGIGIVTAIIVQLLKKADKEEIATLVTLAGLILTLLMVIDMISVLLDTIKDVFQLY